MTNGDGRAGGKALLVYKVFKVLVYLPPSELKWTPQWLTVSALLRVLLLLLCPWNHYCQPSSVAGYHGSAMSAVTHDTLSNIIMQGKVDGSRRRGRPRKSRKDNVKKLTGQSMSALLRIADDIY